MSKEYIDREAAIVIADHAADEHPYDKYPKKPETLSEYNEGWNDACDYIREELENATSADVVAVETLEKWLYEIAMNNVGVKFDGDFSDACEDIIQRLDGLRWFAKDMMDGMET